MDVAALIAWIVTAAGGAYLLATWLAGGGVRQAQTGGTRFPPVLIFGHFLLAAAGLVIWIVYMASDESSGLAWTSFGILVVVALLGFTMFARWVGDRRTGDAAFRTSTPSTGGATRAGAATVPAEQRFPVAVVALHGVLGATTLVLVLIAAITS
jgi:hypothetical protein